MNEVEIKNENLVNNFEKQITFIDDEIFKLDNMKDCYSVYKDSHSLINAYKKSDDKPKFKQENYYQFKQYDIAKRNINYLKKHYEINDEPSLHYKLSLMSDDRNLLYGSLGKQPDKELQLEQQQEKDKVQKKRKEREI